ncbi:MAG: heme lyase CcmF/NrfE family subunit [Magnetospirillum sp. WYHS-4]
MIVEAGHFALILALLIAAVQAVVPMVGAARGNAVWMAMGRSAAVMQLAMIGLAFAALTYAYVTSDFSVENVFRNSHSDKPMLYKVSGVWANHEGSMLLWVTVLAAFSASVALFGRNLPPSLKARVLAIQGLISVGFLLFILLTSNPFVRMMPAPENGKGLNPLLQDPGLAFHPPFLYLGYVGFSVAFSFAMAALIEGRVDAAWARWVRPWTLAAWAFLTIGIVLGSWWAYYELGWGGWWYWDPVENASFMPWLAGTALLHSSIVVEKRNALKGWTVFLAIVAFAMSLLGTFLVRSGVLTSVHAFATDPERGVFILILLMGFIGGGFSLFALRGPSLKAGSLFQPMSREGSLLLNNLLMTTAAGVVLLGTLYPLLLDALGGGKVSVGPPFFNAVFVPLMIPMVLAMAAGPFLSWKRGEALPVLAKLRLAGGLALAAALATGYVWGGQPLLALLGMALAFWLFAGTLTELADRIRLFRASLAESLRLLARVPRAAWGMTVAHAGLAVAIVGITGSSAWKVEHIQVMRPGDTVQVAGYDYTFHGARDTEGPNYIATVGNFTVSRGGKEIVKLEPEKRVYPVEGRPSTEAAIHSMVSGDLYAVIGDEDKGGGYVTRLYFNPLVAWIWAGSALLVLGATISLSDRRHRIGAPRRKVAGA